MPAPGESAASAADQAAAPSWGRVAVTTVRLWAWRRLRSISSWSASGRQERTQFRWRQARPRRRGVRRWQLAAYALALALIAVTVLRFTGVFAGTASPGARVSSPGDSAPGSVGSADAGGTSAPAAATTVQSEAAAWIADQVTSDAIIACDPVMCAALQAQHVSADRLLLLRLGSASRIDADVVVTSSSANDTFADEYAPAVIASFGSGGSRIEVRAIVPGGKAAYESALRADLAARRSAGSQLLRNGRIQFTAQDAGQLRAGEVDSRLLATLAALSSQYSFRVTAFGDAAPGVQVLFRAVTLTFGGGDGPAELSAALALVRAQDPPYLPADSAIVHQAGGSAALSIQFAAPSPLGLLTTVLTDDLHAAARTTVMAEGFSLGQALTG